MKRKLLLQILVLLQLSNSIAASTQGTWIPAAKADVMDAYRNAAEWFVKTPNYQLSIRYASFVDYNTPVAYDHSEGSYIRYGKNVCSTMFGTTTVQNSSLRFLVDSTNQMIILNNAAPAGQSPVDLQSLSDLLDHVQSMKKQVLAGGNMLYRIEFKPNEEYSACEFELNEKGLFSKLYYYYSKEMSDEDEEGDDAANRPVAKTRPRLEIAFTGYKQLNRVDEQVFSEKKYFRIAGGKVIPADKYKNYQVKDYRTATK